jgi:hypothetical protein
MPRQLPPRPHLDYLRKEAKELLPDLRRRRPDARLSDAQHALARQYGFASWRALRTHVQSLVPVTAPEERIDLGFERYTPRARQALFFSRFEAAALGSAAIEVGHVLLGVIRSCQHAPDPVVRPDRVSLDRSRQEVAAHSIVRAALPTSTAIPFAAATQSMLRRAREQSEGKRNRGIGPGHLLLAMLGEPDEIVTSVLAAHDLRADALRDDLLRSIDEASS